MTIRRIGIMTGGGDCPGLNPVIRAVVKKAIRVHGWEVLGIEDAFCGLIDLDYRSPHGNRWLTEDSVRDIHVRGGTILGTSNRADPFRYPVESGGVNSGGKPVETVETDVFDRVVESGGVGSGGKSVETVETDVFDRVRRNVETLGLDAIVSIGGDGSMAIAQKCIQRGLTSIVGVPKTIDNDLGATDYTFGFDSAVQVATEAIDRLRDTAESHDRVMLVEVMGRDAGWIALHAGVAGGAHAILIPEIPYRLAPIADKIRQRQAAGQPYSIVVVAEGAKPHGGEVSTLGPAEAGAMKRLYGAAARVAADLRELVDLDIRFTVLGHIQRGGSPSNFDRILGTRFGDAAVDLLASGTFGHMVALKGTNVVSVPIAEAIGQNKVVTPDSPLVTTARAMGTVFGDE